MVNKEVSVVHLSTVSRFLQLKLASIRQHGTTGTMNDVGLLKQTVRGQLTRRVT